MAFNDTELKIIQAGVSSGKSKDEVRKALANYRAGYIPKQETVEQNAGGIADRISNVITKQGQEVQQAISGEGKYAGETPIRRGVEATAEAFKAVPSVAVAAAPEPVRSTLGAIGETIGGAFKKLTDVISDVPALQKWTQEHPEAARALEEVAGTAKAGGEIAGTILLADQATKGMQAVTDIAGKQTQRAYESARTATEPLISKTTEYVRSKGGIIGAGKELVKPTKTLEGAVGEVLQGKPKDVAKGVETFKAIDTSDVTTFKELQTKIDDAIGEMSTKVDDALAQDTSRTTLENLTTNLQTKAGGTVSTNYVETALNNLKELYQKTGDVAKAQDIDDILTSAKTNGLTKLEINDISRLYNIEFGSKAFNKIGEPLTSVNAQMYETIRKGLKGKAREGMGGTEAQSIDQTISSLYNTKALVTKNVDAVNRLQQKIANMGVLEKTAHALTKYADLITGGSIRGFIGGLLPRGAGYKVMNALDLEERLRKNLDIINNALKSTDKTQIEKLIDGL